jgi:hypothetical protein
VPLAQSIHANHQAREDISQLHSPIAHFEPGLFSRLEKLLELVVEE